MSPDIPHPSIVSVLRCFPRPPRSLAVAELGASTPWLESWVAKLIDAGLIRREISSGDRVWVTSEVAYHALQSLAAYCEQVPESDCRDALVAPGQAGWTRGDVFRMETRRVSAVESVGIDPKPLRWQASALIIVKARRSNEDVYLLTQRLGWEGFGLIGGKFDPRHDRSLADTARRELVEELDLSPGEFRVRPLPVRPVTVKAVSQRLGVYTEYRFEFFQLFATRRLRQDERCEWFDRESIFRGMTKTGESLNHLAYPEVHQALWEDLPGSLDGLEVSLPPLD